MSVRRRDHGYGLRGVMPLRHIIKRRISRRRDLQKPPRRAIVKCGREGPVKCGVPINENIDVHTGDYDVPH